ncbi:MAG TPA: CBS domain-containing protein [Rhodanobacteraceae bacterium]|nr:CBS domain-containing protein [Rhodanobacteraceae bacterium]
MRVADICTRRTVHTEASASVRAAAELMRKRHVGSLIVTESPGSERGSLGILTDRDIVLAVTASGADPDSLTVGDVMTRSPATCAEDDDLFDAIRIMRTRGVRRLPVVDAEGNLAGIISADDIYGTLGAQLCELGLALTREHVRELETRT